MIILVATALLAIDDVDQVEIDDLRCKSRTQELLQTHPEDFHLSRNEHKVFHAIQREDAAEIQKLGSAMQLLKGPALEGFTPLCFAAFLGSEAAVEALLAVGADPNERCSYKGIGLTALQAAASSGNPCVVRRLLIAGADPNLPNSHGGSPLSRAATVGWGDIVELLLAAGARIEIDAAGTSPVQQAAVLLERGAMEALLRAGADPNMRSRRSDETPLHEAISTNLEIDDPEPIRLMLEHGADACAITDEFRETPLHLAAKFTPQRHEQIITWLVEHGAPLDAEDHRGRTALALAIRKSARIRAVSPDHDPLLAFALLRHGADVRIADEDGVTPLHWAVKLGNADLIRAIVKAGGSHLAENKRGETPLDIVKEHDDPMKRLELRRALAGGGG